MLADGKQGVIDFNKMKSVGVSPFDRDKFLQNFVVEWKTKKGFDFYKSLTEENNNNFIQTVKK